MSFSFEAKKRAVPPAGAEAVLRPGGGLRHPAVLQHLQRKRGADHHREPRSGCPASQAVSPGLRPAVRPAAGGGGRAASWCSRSQTAASSAGSWTCWASARSRTWPCTSTSDCWRRSAAGRPSCGGCSSPGGSVTDPAKRYHLELATSHLQVSRELEVLLRECGYPPKSVARNGSFITYFKQSDQIEDFLTLIGAPVAAMSVMSAKLEKGPAQQR